MEQIKIIRRNLALKEYENGLSCEADPIQSVNSADFLGLFACSFMTVQQMVMLMTNSSNSQMRG
jgi:hypothetical protein